MASPRRLVLLGVTLLASSACDNRELEPVLVRSGDYTLPTPYKTVAAPLGEVPCRITVQGAGSIDLEKDYLPGVITCENGGADIESQRAQAIAARSVAYYSIMTTGSICNSQSCQVYSCGKAPGELERQAVRETSGVYLTYNNLLTYGFYVAGSSLVAGPTCQGAESWVTYNEGRRGSEVLQSSLGSQQSPGNALYGQNRGCFSQWGSRCLEREKGYDFLAILRFYYGDDIGLLQADGPCIEELEVEEGGFDDGGGFLTFDSSLPGADGGDGWTSGPGGAAEVTGITNTEGNPVFEGIDTEPAGLPDSYGGLRPGGGIGGCNTGGGRPCGSWLVLGLLGLARRRLRTTH